jgi:hydrogenase expression/formation protein HypE
MRRLIEDVFWRPGPVAGRNGRRGGDPVNGGWLIVTTDSHVIHPIVFPGGDIGRLAVAATVNDLAMMGATEPMGTPCGVILEERISHRRARRLQESMRSACDEAGTRSSPATRR